MKIEEASALFCLGKLSKKQITEVARTEFKVWPKSPALKRLASLPNVSSEKAIELFGKAMIELKIKGFKNKRAAGIWLASNIAQKIIEGSIDPYEGARKIWTEIWLESGNPKELSGFVSLADDYEDTFPPNPEILKEIVKNARRLAQPLIISKAPPKKSIDKIENFG